MTCCLYCIISKSTASQLDKASDPWCRLRGASHYGWRSRGRRFPPIKLLETKSSASGPFTSWPNSKGCCDLNDLCLKKAMDSRRKFGSDGNGETQTMVKGRRFLIIKKSIIDKILAIGLEGLFWARNKVGCSFGFGLWAWPLEASHYARPKAPLTVFYWLYIFSPFLWIVNKVWPLNPTTCWLGRP